MISPQNLRLFQIEKHHLSPENRGRDKSDILTILRDIGGLSWLTPIYSRMKAWQRG